jgi:hypothetical protein
MTVVKVKGFRRHSSASQCDDNHLRKRKYTAAKSTNITHISYPFSFVSSTIIFSQYKIQSNKNQQNNNNNQQQQLTTPLFFVSCSHRLLRQHYYSHPIMNNKSPSPPSSKLKASPAAFVPRSSATDHAGSNTVLGESSSNSNMNPPSRMMLSQSFGGDPSPFLRRSMVLPAPVTGSIQRYVLYIAINM